MYKPWSRTGFWRQKKQKGDKRDKTVEDSLLPGVTFPSDSLPPMHTLKYILKKTKQNKKRTNNQEVIAWDKGEEYF